MAGSRECRSGVRGARARVLGLKWGRRVRTGGVDRTFLSQAPAVCVGGGGVVQSARPIGTEDPGEGETRRRGQGTWSAGRREFGCAADGDASLRGSLRTQGTGRTFAYSVACAVERSLSSSCRLGQNDIKTREFRKSSSTGGVGGCGRVDWMWTRGGLTQVV